MGRGKGNDCICDITLYKDAIGRRIGYKYNPSIDGYVDNENKRVFVYTIKDYINYSLYDVVKIRTISSGNWWYDIDVEAFKEDGYYFSINIYDILMHDFDNSFEQPRDLSWMGINLTVPNDNEAPF